MAPQTLADPQTVQMMADIKRTVWTDKTGISIESGPHKQRNGHPNRHIRINRSIELMPVKMKGVEEETLKVYIADAWPLDDDAYAMNEKLRRAEQGQGPTIRMGRVVPDAGGNMSLILGQVLSPTRKHWKRSDRRRKASIARAARRRNLISLRKPVVA